MNRTNAVVIGGGTGAPASIRTLLDMGCGVSSVVAMVDDGGSTGILRERGGVIPPGDIRKCISAMSANYEGILVTDSTTSTITRSAISFSRPSPTRPIRFPTPFACARGSSTRAAMSIPPRFMT